MPAAIHFAGAGRPGTAAVRPPTCDVPRRAHRRPDRPETCGRRQHILARATSRGDDADPAAATPRTALPPPTTTDDPSLPPSVWQLKPPWCQPWSILLTGGVAVAGAGWALGWVGGGIVGAGVAVWWWLFLLEMPQGYAEYRQAALQQRQGGGGGREGWGE